MGCYGVSDDFQKWIEEHEYAVEYQRDMNAAVKEVI
jgi:hypothetical protein